jgi:hypothetical protein
MYQVKSYSNNKINNEKPQTNIITLRVLIVEWTKRLGIVEK